MRKKRERERETKTLSDEARRYSGRETERDRSRAWREGGHD